MLKLLLLLAGIFAGFYACRWVQSSTSDTARVLRVLIWGDERRRRL